MPTLPTYESKKNIVQPRVSSQPAIQEQTGASEAYEGTQNILKGAGEVIGAWQKAQDVMDYTKAKVMYETGIAQVKMNAANDPNPDNLATHQKALQDLTKDFGNQFHNKELATKAKFELDHDIGIASMEIGSTFKKKQLFQNELNLETAVKTATTEIADAISPTLAAQKRQETIALINANFARGNITQGKANKLVDDLRLGVVDLDIFKDKAVNPYDSYVVSELKKGDKGIYADLTDSERADRLEKAELHIGRNRRLNEFAIKENQDKNEADLLVAQMEGRLAENTLKNMLLSGGVRRPFGEKLMKNLYAAPAENTNFEVYNKIRDMQVTGKTRNEINQAILDNTTKLTAADTKFLIDATFKNEDTKRNAQIKYNSDALKVWAASELGRMHADPDMENSKLSNNIVYEFNRRVNEQNAEGAVIDEIAQTLVKQKIKEFHPQTALMEDVPNFVASRNRIKKVYGKNSKLKGTAVKIQPVNVVISNDNGINFDDL